MRRCKYFRRISWTFYDKKSGFGIVSAIKCDCGKFVYNYSEDNTTGCEMEPLYPCYEPVELDPYWKDIVDETNRRIDNEK